MWQDESSKEGSFCFLEKKGRSILTVLRSLFGES